MKKLIEINDTDAEFLKDYKKSHGTSLASFIDMAIREKIINTKAELMIRNMKTDLSKPLIISNNDLVNILAIDKEPINPNEIKRVINRGNLNTIK